MSNVNSNNFFLISLRKDRGNGEPGTAFEKNAAYISSTELVKPPPVND